MSSCSSKLCSNRDQIETIFQYCPAERWNCVLGRPPAEIDWDDQLSVPYRVNHSMFNGPRVCKRKLLRPTHSSHWPVEPKCASKDHSFTLFFPCCSRKWDSSLQQPFAIVQSPISDVPWFIPGVVADVRLSAWVPLSVAGCETPKWSRVRLMVQLQIRLTTQMYSWVGCATVARRCCTSNLATWHSSRGATTRGRPMWVLL